MKLNILRSGKSMVVAVHDGLSWRAYALQGARGAWHCTGSAVEPSRNARQLPKTMLDFIARSGARRLRILLSGDVHVLTTVLPEDATDEELHTALSYEAQGETGLEAGNHRVAATPAHLFGMGGDRKTLLAAGFEIGQLERIASDAESEGARFEAAGSLELALLAAHAQQSPNRRLLLVRERTSFYAVPAGDAQTFAVTVIPLGRDTTTDPAARERAVHARERLNMQAALPLTVVLTGTDERLRSQIAPSLGVCRDIAYVEWNKLEDEAVRVGAGTRVGGLDGPCPWIGLPPTPRDPHRHGNVILAVIVAITVTWTGLRWQELKGDLRAARANRAAWESLEQARKEAEAESRSLKQRQDDLLARKAMLESPQPLPPGLLSLLKTLAEQMPPYSSLESIRQRPGGGFEISGLTRWQDGLTQLDKALRDLGRREGMHREIGNLEALPEQNAQRFRYDLVPGEEQP